MTHTNRLINETSPYLLQHAHNPVDWFAWNEEAFAKARAEDKPIFLSIGYSACHWCHVMERESFENDEIAAVLNRDFVSIKVDREERPDVDSIYMQAVQLMTGHGGWPMSMFLTPEAVPFYGGTYFPPEDRYGMPSFRHVLEHVRHAYHERKDEVAQASTEIQKLVAAQPNASASSIELTPEKLLSLARQASRNFDPANGGFGGAPKFPPTMTLEHCAIASKLTGDPVPREVVEFTLRKMALGGIYDQIGGGFHRYSVDAHWLVPHFEKMLYDNALLARAYVHAWQWSKDDFFARVAKETLGFITREMMSPEGGFYSTLDADSEGVEGKFYVWSRAEILATLGDEEGRVFCALYDVTEAGNWEHHNILNIPRDPQAVADDHNVTLDELFDIAARGKCKLYGVREQRVRPGRDEKILAGWNGWMLAAFAEAALAFDSSEYRDVVQKNARFLVDTMLDGGRLHRSYKDGRARIPAMLEDYAGVAWGLIGAFEATRERNHLDVARKLAEEMLSRFIDDERGGFYDTPTDHETLIARPKELMDNATPAGNSLAAMVMAKLFLYFGDERYRAAADGSLRCAATMLERYPSAFGFLLEGAGHLSGRPKEIAITGDAAFIHQAMKTLGEEYVPLRIVIAGDCPDTPLMQGRETTQSLIYVCEGYECKFPVGDVEEFRKLL